MSRITMPLWIAATLLLGAAGCSQAPAPEAPATTAASSVAEPTPVTAALDGEEPVETRPLVEPLPVPEEVNARPEPERRTRPRQVVIESTPPEPAQPTLLEASRRAKQEKRTRGEQKPVAVITDENLKEYAARGKVTIAKPDRPTTTGEPSERSTEGAGAIETEEGEIVSPEDYWIGRLRTLRQNWRDTFDEMDELEARAEELRTDFYAADDPRFRDTRIKPAWDRVLDRIQQARRDLARYQDEVAVALEEGRRAGALPGWLRAGAELEPPPPEPDDADLTETDSREPTILEEPPQ